MIQVNELIDKIDDARANAVSDEEFEQVWKNSLDEKVQKSMMLWDELLNQSKDALKNA